MVLGAQLFTVREFTQDLNSFAETLKKVADIGYRVVQVSATCPYEADWLAEQLQSNGLSCPVTHTPPDRLANEPVAVAAEHRRFGCGVAGLGSAPGFFKNGYEDYVAFRNDFLPVSEALKQGGITLGYHNHQVEFGKFEGETLLERMSRDFPADQLVFILDTYWTQYSGGNPAAWLRRLSGRVPCVHFKDLAIVGTQQRMAVVGEGNMDWDSIIAACAEAGTRYALVEQDDCYGEDPFDCLHRSYRYLKTMGLE